MADAARSNLSHYLKGDETIRWGTIGLSVMATQASAITFLSTPGQAYESGMGFVQNYFGLPFALIVVCAVFIPIYHRLKVITAYEYLGQRFDQKTRLLGASLSSCSVVRGGHHDLRACHYYFGHPGLEPSTNHSPLRPLRGCLYNGWRHESGQHHRQMADGGDPDRDGRRVRNGYPPAAGRLSFGEALYVAGGDGKLNAVNFSFDIKQRYTFWSGLLGGFFLALAYFGTDQSQVQRYLAGGSLIGSRFGLLFNAVAEGADAVPDPAHRRDGFRFLSIREATNVFQPTSL